MALYTSCFLSTLMMMVVTDAAEYCKWEVFEAKCPNHEVITIDTAKYGRLTQGRCIQRDYGYVGCYTDVKAIAEKNCSGRQECSIIVPNKEMDFIRMVDCPSDLTGYLFINYTCKKVIKPEERGSCNLHPGISPSHAFIASASTKYTGCGQNDRPWKILASKGQRVNLTLHDYGSSAAGTHTPCKVYAVIKDVHGEISKPVCGGSARVVHAYISKGSEVEIRILPTTGSYNRYFLLEYNSCADIPSPDGGWVQYAGSDATIGCTDSSDTWRLKCSGHDWKGEIGMCGGRELIIGRSKNQNGGTFTVNKPLSVIIVVCVAILLGLVILGAGVCCLRRRRNHLYASARQRGPQADALKDFPPDYHSNAPPSYYDARNMTPEHEYEYVSDVLQRKEQISANHLIPTSGHVTSEMSSYTGTGYGTLPPVPVPIPNPQIVLKNKPGPVAGNVYVPDNISLTSPKYFELDASQRAKQNGGAGGGGGGTSNAYNSLHQCAQVSKQQFGHYSQ